MKKVAIPAIEQVPIDSLKTDGQNPNIMTPRQLQRLRESIQKYGFIVPVITNKDLLIADGEQRYTAAKELQMPKVPVIRLPIQDVDRRILRQVLNKLKGEHEYMADAMEFERIIMAGKETELKEMLALSTSELQRYMQMLHPQNEDEIPPLRETDIKLGDIFQLGNHRLICGDAGNENHLSMLLENKQIQMVLTDPPYNVDYVSKNLAFISMGKAQNAIRRAYENDNVKDLKEFTREWLANTTKHLAEKNAIYIFFGYAHLHTLFDGMEEAKITLGQLLVWVKNTFVLGRSDYFPQHEHIVYAWYGRHNYYAKRGIETTTVWLAKKPSQSQEHPTSKPVELLKKAIYNSSLDNENVLDLFAGSGSTLIACEQTNRNCYSLEIMPAYCQVTIDRWEKLTGKQAQKLDQIVAK